MISDLRTELSQQIIKTGLPIYSSWPANVSPPCAILTVDSINYDVTLPRGTPAVTWKLTVLILLQGDIQESQNFLDAYMNATGTNSIKYQIESHTYTNCDFARFVNWTNFGGKTVNETSYYGCDGIIETK
jgi:hypothetical protein